MWMRTRTNHTVNNSPTLHSCSADNTPNYKHDNVTKTLVDMNIYCRFQHECHPHLLAFQLHDIFHGTGSRDCQNVSRFDCFGPEMNCYSHFDQGRHIYPVVVSLSHRPLMPARLQPRPAGCNCSSLAILRLNIKVLAFRNTVFHGSIRYSNYKARNPSFSISFLSNSPLAAIEPFS